MKIKYYHIVGIDMYKHNKKDKVLLSIISSLQTYYHFKLDLQKVDQHTWGKWLLHGAKHTRTISGKAWNSLVEYPWRKS